MKRLFTPLFLILLLPGTSAAFCMEPSEPFCLSSYTEFSSEGEYNNCKYELDLYLNALNDYARCQIQEIENKREEAIEAFNSRVDSSPF